MSSIVANALDTTVTVQAPTSSQDGYGHTTKTYTTVTTAKVNMARPNDTQLSLYADIIGSQNSYMMRFMSTAGISEGYRIVYQSKNWEVQNVRNAGSYMFANESLITEVQ